ncbi:MAG: sulfatase-like hydrolase/transferase [Planctomycetes bacterium]|nr:sulfatase-like hydrolase/transferase [Planctomycetota bacterium]
MMMLIRYGWLLHVGLAISLTAAAGWAAAPTTWPGDKITGPYVSRLSSRPATQPFSAPAWPLASRPATASAPAGRPAAKRAIPSGPNVILITVGNQSAGMTGFEGHPQIKTPNLDRLAADGMHFQRCYTPTPMSAASMASILTGQYPHTHGVVTDKSALASSSDTFTAQLHAAGYRCGIVGKWNLPGTTAKAPGFGLTDFVATQDVDAEGRGWKWEQCPVWVQGNKTKADKFLTDWEADRAIEFVEKHKEQPFFLWLSFRTNEEPLTRPPGTEKEYPPGAMNLPDPKTKTRSDQPSSLQNVAAAKAKNDQELREARSKLAAMIWRMDENVGRLMVRLDELNLHEKTVVIVTSDGGFALGEHGLYGRGPFVYDIMIRCPLVVRYPKLVRSGDRCARTVSLVDLAPTICELAGLQQSPMMHGHSLVPLLKNPASNVLPDERFLEYDAQDSGRSILVRGVVTSQYKYARYLRDGNYDVLYHLARDAEEMNNVAKKPDSVRHYAGVVKVLQNRVERFRKMTRDQAR